MNNFYRKHYTIIEMLVVISILGVLIAMGAPAAIRMMSKQKSTVAKQDIQAIVQAFKAYEAEYGRLPFATTQTTDIVTSVASPAKNSMQLINELLDNSATDNPRGIKFLKWVDRYTSATATGGTLGEDSTTPDNWLDPWGSPYVVGIDYDYDGRVAIFDADGDKTYETNDDENLRGSVFVFSKGEDMLESTTATDDEIIDWEYCTDGSVSASDRASSNSDNIKSWK